MQKEIKHLKPNIRRLSVSYFYRRTKVPFIRLTGKWLENAGFCPSDQISVKVENQKLVIEMLKET